MEYVIGRAADWHREHLGHLYGCWVQWNDLYFDGRLVAPYLLLAAPGWSKALGDFARTSCFGGKGQIRIRPSLIDGTHPHLRPGPEYAGGRRRFVEDVGLHETVHLWAEEFLHAPERGYKGHGPVFAGECNRIGQALGLGPVRQAKARGANAQLPSCAQWPHNVRPEGYYLGALAPPPAPEPAEPAPAAMIPVQIVVDRLLGILCVLESEPDDEIDDPLACGAAVVSEWLQELDPVDENVSTDGDST
jgi:hypothetical protein